MYTDIPLHEAIKLVSVTNLRFTPSGRKGMLGVPQGRWEFDVTYGENTRPRSYYTSNGGDGLWADLGGPMGDDRQVAGTCQFGLAGCTSRQAYDRIRRYFAKLV